VEVVAECQPREGRWVLQEVLQVGDKAAPHLEQLVQYLEVAVAEAPVEAREGVPSMEAVEEEAVLAQPQGVRRYLEALVVP
jgi:hypothetical protein